MRVIYCFTEPEKHSLVALKKFAPQAEMVNTSSSIWAYGEAIASRWTAEDDLVVIEGDKEITADVLPSFERCNLPWCNFSSFIFPDTNQQRETFIGLGCTKYSAEAQRFIGVDDFICPDEAVLIGNECQICGGKGCWNNLDGRIARALRKVNINVHVHGRVEHHHDYSGIVCKDALDYAYLSKAVNRQHHVNFAEAEKLAGPNWRKSEAIVK